MIRPQVDPQRLIQARFVAGLNQADLAEKAGLDPSYVSLIEAGKRKPTAATAAKLAAALDVEVTSLLTKVRQGRPARQRQVTP